MPANAGFKSISFVIMTIRDESNCYPVRTGETQTVFDGEFNSSEQLSSQISSHAVSVTSHGYPAVLNYFSVRVTVDFE